MFASGYMSSIELTFKRRWRFDSSSKYTTTKLLIFYQTLLSVLGIVVHAPRAHIVGSDIDRHTCTHFGLQPRLVCRLGYQR